MDLYAIVKADTGAMLWGGFVSQEEAETKALTLAVNTGSINLLSGTDLGWHLLERPQEGE